MAPIRREVIPGLLLWAPEQEGAGLKQQDKVVLSVVELMTEAEAFYEVPHYPKVSYGRCFGPIGLDKTIRFCECLFNRLLEALNMNSAVEDAEFDSAKIKCIALTTPPGDKETRTNAVAMLGAFLILRHRWSPEKVRKVLGEQDARLKFACSWQRRDKLGAAEGDWNYSVYHCWRGIELAVRLDWINPVVVSQPRYRKDYLQRYCRWATSYDGTWIAPGFILVTADPSTTAADPNPATFKQVIAVEDYMKNREDFSSQASTTAASRSQQAESPPPAVILENPEASNKAKRQGHGRSMRRQSSKVSRQSLGSMTSMMSLANVTKRLAIQLPSAPSDALSTDTVNKEFLSPMEKEGLASDCDGEGRPLAFVGRLKRSGVQVMIRCNFAEEPGMPEEVYDPENIEDAGIIHADIVVPDYDGGLPTAAGYRDALELVEAMKLNEDSSADDEDWKSSAVAIHCKGGFGRSIVLACCLAIDFYDIPGEAMMGWVRVARPGALTSPIQEKFLMRMTGRSAIRRWAKLPCEEQRPSSPCCVM